MKSTKTPTTISTREALELLGVWRKEAFNDGDSDRLNKLNRFKVILLTEN